MYYKHTAINDDVGETNQDYQPEDLYKVTLEKEKLSCSKRLVLKITGIIYMLTCTLDLIFFIVSCYRFFSRYDVFDQMIHPVHHWYDFAVDSLVP